MKLNKQQKDIYKRFKKGESIIVDAPRRSGKTELLRYIIKNNKDINFSVFTFNYRIFNQFYGDLKNAFYRGNKNYVIADEVFYYNQYDKQCISIGTFNKDVSNFKWEIPDHLKPFLEEYKKNLTKKDYIIFFGLYEKY